jgi:hypothetical protein
MELTIELQGLALEDWFLKLNNAIATLPDASDLSIAELRKPTAGFGAGDNPGIRLKMAAALTVASQLASILGFAANLYLHQPNPPEECELFLKNGQVETVARFSCKTGLSPEVVGMIKAHVEKNGAPSQVKITPVQGRRK